MYGLEPVIVPAPSTQQGEYGLTEPQWQTE